MCVKKYIDSNFSNFNNINNIYIHLNYMMSNILVSDHINAKNHEMIKLFNLSNIYKSYMSYYGVLNKKKINLDTDINNTTTEFKYFKKIMLSHIKDSVLYKKYFNTTIDLKNFIKTISFVVNLDVYGGSGLHWTSIFIDLRNNKNNDNNTTLTINIDIEYFDSIGFKYSKFDFYKKYIKNIILSIAIFFKFAFKEKGLDSNISFYKNKYQHQQSDTECGIYSIFYILTRLNNFDKEIIYNKHFCDNFMKKLRTIFFSECSL